MIDDHAAVAIIGVAICLEDAPDIESFWRQSPHGRSAASMGASRGFDDDRSGIEAPAGAIARAALRDAGIDDECAIRTAGAGR